MADLIERAKAVAERLEAMDVPGAHYTRNTAAAIIRELIARVEAMGPIAGEG